MQKILILNAGSSSLKWQLFEMPSETVIAKGAVDRLAMTDSIFTIKYAGNQKYTKTIDHLDHEDAAQLLLAKLQELNIITSLSDLSGVGHRVVAGGEVFKHAVKVTPERLKQIDSMKAFAPLHNPMEVNYIKIMQHVLPQVAQYAVFDSQFFTDLPEENAIYSIPYEDTQKFNIRRYGEHGISHQYLANRAAELLGKPLADLKMITLHLGSGSSVAAEKSGKAYDTSMGFTPLTGLTMGTRAGDVDPAVVPYLMEKLHLDSATDVIKRLNQQSGLLGISGISSDMRDLKAATDNPRAQLAIEIFINRVVKYVGSYFAELGGLDVLVFAGGIGEHNAELRAEIGKRLAALGVTIDSKLNAAGKEGLLSMPEAKVQVMLVPTNEELAMVRQVGASLESV
ncbi:acetate/propionate family kinase [Loigolactobacillus backii]|uniref:Acetate kinase n=1 Tax=Loigolactobacillus backii TaxID=375175 RepID=A0A192H1N2_9LACO|nr:acetate kinase [Loigolactobacillus backii]ANK60412.1 acetate kinase [Loigolactobacillus backii]ANK62147.1 acetate kinase [Loigolactobacillus backii]ANK65291.1 acetate kinase [Loigolactobacillus backii]ANK67852.1 acetate kinase [Loigolactobacillus backii]ANK70838.1 acetate kinase [Loigolactobacillus backii]